MTATSLIATNFSVGTITTGPFDPFPPMTGEIAPTTFYLAVKVWSYQIKGYSFEIPALSTQTSGTFSQVVWKNSKAHRMCSQRVHQRRRVRRVLLYPPVRIRSCRKHPHPLVHALQERLPCQPRGLGRVKIPLLQHTPNETNKSCAVFHADCYYQLRFSMFRFFFQMDKQDPRT